METAMTPKDFSVAVKDIKIAILQARARVARVSNVEALKLYFYVGGYISKKTRSAKWGTGAIEALSNRLQVELPGLRGFSVASIRKMRLFFEAWADCFEIRSLPTNELTMLQVDAKHSLSTNEFSKDDLSAFLSVGFTHHVAIFMAVKEVQDRWYYIRRCASEQWTVIDLERALNAKEHLHVGALANNFTKTLSPMALATKAVRSFKDEYLLFSHRGLKAMVAIELKMGDCHPGYLGQLNFYLSALDKLMKKPDEKGQYPGTLSDIGAGNRRCAQGDGRVQERNGSEKKMRRRGGANMRKSEFKDCDVYALRIDELRPFPKETLKSLRDYYRVGLTYMGNALEGNSLTESETKVVIEDGLTIGGKPLKDVYEATGHAKAYDLIWNIKKLKSQGRIRRIGPAKGGHWEVVGE